MATFTVTTKFDEEFTGATEMQEAGDGDGLSLREAIGLANPNDTIEFDTGTATLLRLTLGEIHAPGNLIINGGGVITITGDANNDDTTLAGNITDVDASAGRLSDNSRIFFVDGGNLTLDGLTITGGRTTGDTANSGAGTQGGAIHVDGLGNTLTITNSTIAGNSTNGLNAEGGAIYADGVLNISDSTISGNVTQGERSFGGAIYAQANVTIINTTIAYNETQGDRGYGGAIFADGGVVNVLNSTIVGNKALGQIDNNTSFNVGSAIYSDNTLIVANSIVIDNEATQDGGPQLQEKNATGQGDGVVGFYGANIIGADTATANGSTVINADRDDVFTGTLRDNGGPVQTIALKVDATNPALDASSVLPTSADARGVDAFDFPGVGASEGTGLRDLGAHEFGGAEGSLVVTTTADGYNYGDGETTLREAIAFANATPGADTITFTAGGQGLIRLTIGEIEITDDLTINGGGLVTITGDANGDDVTTTGDITDVAASLAAGALDDNSRIFVAPFEIGTNPDGSLFDASADLTIDGLTVTGGRADEGGGAIRASGALTVEDSTLSGNSTDSFQSAGGAINARGGLTLANSTISDNVTDGHQASGGGIFSSGGTTITNSVISGNTTTGSAADGGGLLVSGGGATITNTTFTGNKTTGEFSDGGGVLSFTDLTLTNSTFTGNSTAGPNANGGGVFGRADVVVENSILLGNVALQGDGDEIAADTLNGDGSVTFNGLSLVGADGDAIDATGINGSGGAVIADAADVFAQTQDNNGVQVGVLADNGGAVQTVALKADLTNPALDASNATGTDARGEARGFDQANVDNGGTSDLGAFELTETVEANSLIVTTTDDVVDATDGVTSLREAVAFANDKAGADTITFAAGGQGLIRLTEGRIDITDALTVDGDGLVTITGDADANDTTLEGGITDVASTIAADNLGDNSQIFRGTADLTLDGLTITGAANNFGGGGAVLALTGDLTINSSVLAGNRAFLGGAVYATRDLTISDSDFSGNAAFARGGAIATSVVSDDGYSATITGSSFSNNTSGSSGGAIRIGYAGTTLEITNSAVSGNSTTDDFADGGGVDANGDVIITNSTISGNTASGDFADGGGVHAEGDVTIVASTITGNSVTGAEGDGGGVFSRGQISVTNSIVLGNIATQGEGDELHEVDNSSGSVQIGVIEVSGQNIIGANTAGFDITSRVDPSQISFVQNAAAADVFDVTANNNGVTAGVLADNGGDVQTVALKANASNVALDAATIAGTDARGENRAVDLAGVANGGASDLGAFELQETALAGFDEDQEGDGDPNLLTGTENAETLRGLGGDDTILGLGGDDTLEGGADDDTLEGGDGDDVLGGGAGDDLFNLGAGANAVAGGSGFDTVKVTAASTDLSGNSFAQVEVLDADGFDIFVDAGQLHAFSSIENASVVTHLSGGVTNLNGRINTGEGLDFQGSSADDVFNAQGMDVAANWFGNDGDDILRAGSANDMLRGGSGADRLLGGGGNDTLRGEDGDDILIGGDGGDALFGGAGADIIRGQGGEDTLNGGGGADRLFGNALSDTFIGGAGDDVLDGQGGADVLNADVGDDIIRAGVGNDIVNGGAGDDILSGEAGRDMFVFAASDGFDRITDWEDGLDQIDFSGHEGYNSFADVQANIIQSGANVRIQLDPVADRILLLDTNLSDIDETDFIF